MKLKLVVSAMLLSLLVSCASKNEVKNKIETEVQTTSLEDRDKIHHDIHEGIMNSDKLSATQKKQIMDTYSKFKKDDKRIADDIEKSKLVLVQTILNPNMSTLEYNTLKDKIVKLNNERLTKTFSSSEEVRKIINKTNFSETDKQLLEQLYRKHIFN